MRPPVVDIADGDLTAFWIGAEFLEGPGKLQGYGADLIQLATDILQKRNVPPAVFAKHELLTRENVDSFYPGDSVLSDAYEKIR